ncbi:hypothetical protein MOO46_07465 (plasmid) [Apilactobacillus apisilvae]|uniref:Uncharacterized protein n=1 Tax=Apilactobacillus apisilvae TaxID=2923364 RepID=A0ABY4PJT7_9LACO|nr:hypothetical protein [Apilactobacillus apisilvae]UQS85822.1 hypothetical protein MOO46_07465 [Apilactobacillus apisilvae]
MNKKQSNKEIEDAKLKAQADASYINWLLMNEFTFEQAIQLLSINKMQEAFYEQWKGNY